MMTRLMGMIDCEEALRLLWEFLDGELGAREAERVKAHLELCGRCYPQYDFQRAYFEYTRRIRDRDRAPAELRRRLFRMLLEQEGGNGQGR